MDERIWLEENIKKYNFKELTIEYNKAFNKNKSEGALKTYCYKRGIKRENLSKPHSFTPAQVEWLKENYKAITSKEVFFRKKLTEDFNKEFKTDVKELTIVNKCKTLGLKQNSYSFTEEQNEWLAKNCLNYDNYRDFCNVFNEKFNANKKRDSFMVYCLRKNFLVEDTSYWSEEQEDFIRENYELYTANKLTELLNEKFGIQKNLCVVKHKITKLNCCSKVRYYTEEEKEWILNNLSNYKTFDGLYNAFNEKFNLNISEHKFRNLIYTRMKLTLAEEGYKRSDYHEIGTEKTYDGVVYIKVRDDLRHKANYQIKSRYMYEQYHNVKLDKEQFVVFLDGDNTNFDKDNLFLVSHNGYATMPPEWRKCGNPKLKRIMFLQSEAKCLVKQMKIEKEKK